MGRKEEVAVEEGSALKGPSTSHTTTDGTEEKRPLATTSEETRVEKETTEDKKEEAKTGVDGQESEPRSPSDETVVRGVGFLTEEQLDAIIARADPNLVWR